MVTGILGTIGHTPLVRLRNITASTEGQILLKYERINPGGSIKDRSAVYIINEAERRGLLLPGGTIIESSSGNFGISLAMISAARGYHAIILVDPKTTSSNLALLKCFGAEVIVVTEKDDSGSYHKTRIALANKLAKEIPNSFRPDQCFNLLNSEAHYHSTAKEIMEDYDENLAAVVAAVSTGGQLGGISKYIKMSYPSVQVIGVDANGSAIFGGDAHSYRIPGIGLGWTPNNLQLDLIDRAYKISDAHAFETARAIARYEGVLIGPSSGACILAALSIVDELPPEKRIVCVASDGGDRYIQTMCNDEWMDEQGFSTCVSISELRKMAKNLCPWSTCPSAVSNYRDDLIDGLDMPETTRNINKEIEDSYTAGKKVAI